MKTSLLPCSLNLVVISRPPQYNEFYTFSHGLYSNLITSIGILTTFIDAFTSLIGYKAYGTLNASIIYWYSHSLYWYSHCLYWYSHCLYWYSHCLYWYIVQFTLWNASCRD
jgi:hypothetical protein